MAPARRCARPHPLHTYRSALSGAALSVTCTYVLAVDVSVRRLYVVQVMAYDGIRMNTRHVNSAWMAGVTTAVSQPWGNQLVAGLSVAFHTYGATVQQSLVHPHSALHVNIGQYVTRAALNIGLRGRATRRVERRM